MGCRACLVTKYVCEYGDSQSFNWLAEELYDMLCDIGVDVYTSDQDGDYYGHWHVNLDGESEKRLKDYVAKLGALPPDEVNEYFKDNDWVTNDYVKSVFEEWMRWSDETGKSVVRIHWL